MRKNYERDAIPTAENTKLSFTPAGIVDGEAKRIGHSILNLLNLMDIIAYSLTLMAKLRYRRCSLKVDQASINSYRAPRYSLDSAERSVRCNDRSGSAIAP